MEKTSLQNQEIEYKLRRSRRTKHLRLAVYCDASVVVTLPRFASLNLVEKFLQEKATWLLEKIAKFQKNGSVNFLRQGTRADFLKNKKEALRFVRERVTDLNKLYQFKYNKITVRNQKTRWGSCSRKGNLNFNYKILFLPKNVADYIVVHELCHLQEFNHGQKFWSLVAQAVPDYLKLRRSLKNS